MVIKINQEEKRSEIVVRTSLSWFGEDLFSVNNCWQYIFSMFSNFLLTAIHIGFNIVGVLFSCRENWATSSTLS